MRDLQKVYNIKFSSVYPHYIQKAEKKNRSKAEVNQLITWLTGYSEEDIAKIISSTITMEDFFNNCPNFNPNANKITGVICGYKVQEIEDDILRKIRYLDKIIDELAKGKDLKKIQRF